MVELLCSSCCCDRCRGSLLNPFCALLLQQEIRSLQLLLPLCLLQEPLWSLPAPTSAVRHIHWSLLHRLLWQTLVQHFRSQRDQAVDLFPWSCDKCMCKKWSGFVFVSTGKENTLCIVCNPDKDADAVPKFIHTCWCRGQSLLAKLVYILTRRLEVGAQCRYFLHNCPIHGVGKCAFGCEEHLHACVHTLSLLKVWMQLCSYVINSS